jgi:hypothetical protein
VFGRTLGLNFFSNPLTDLGGVVPISINLLSFESYSIPTGCAPFAMCNDREFSAGTVVARAVAAVPEPVSLLLVGLGLIFLWLSRRRMRSI